MDYLYADGGVVLKSPSDIGGSIAYRHVRKSDGKPDEVVFEDSARFYNAHFSRETLEGNITEIYALIRGAAYLLALPILSRPVEVIFVSDSRNALLWFNDGYKDSSNLPEIVKTELAEVATGLEENNIAFTVERVKGHPTPGGRRNGFMKTKKGIRPVSEHNHRCHILCEIQNDLLREDYVKKRLGIR
jgi:hypothetical protein